MKPELRETLGKAVRKAWIQWAKTQNNPKDSWLIPWESMEEQDKEADRQIAEAVVQRLGEMLAIPFLNILFTEEQVKSLLAELVGIPRKE